MTTTQTNPTASKNGTTAAKRVRERKPLTAKSVGMKIADLLEKLGTDQDRAKALHIAKTLNEAGAS